MGAQNVTRVVGPGRGPGGSPLAIAISPVLTGRDAFDAMRRKILDAAPGSRLVPVSAEGIQSQKMARHDGLSGLSDLTPTPRRLVHARRSERGVR